jgi:hypothetical protein
MGSVPHRPRRLTAVGIVACVALAVGCSDDTNASRPSDPTSAAETTSSTTSTTEAPRLDPVLPYEPIAGEPAPDLKALAAATLQALGTYELGDGTRGAALLRVGPDVDPGLIDSAGLLLQADVASSVEIIYPQMGGLTDTAASVMIVYRWRTLGRAGEQTQTRTADVRLVRTDQGWRATTIASLGGDPVKVDLSSATPPAAAVLGNPAIDLADSARWDIAAGRVDDRVLEVMLSLAREHTISVTVLATGHPHEVFDTESVSNHTKGRGVDIWAVDGTPVVAQRAVDSVVAGIVQQLVDQGVTEVGSPWDLDGPGGASFTNTVHQDHLHVAFDD